MAVNKVQSQMRSKIRWGIVGIFALLLVATAYVSPGFFNRGIDKINNIVGVSFPKIPNQPFRLGLDLKGGVHLEYQADVKNIDPADRATAVEGVRDVIERRVNGTGVGESTVQTTKVGEDYNIIVELPGVSDVNRAIQMIGETPTLEFREQNTKAARELTAEEKAGMEKFNAAAKKKADEVVSKVNSGTDFSVAVKDYSDDSVSKNNNGYLGFVSANSFPKEVYNWASTAKQGDITKTAILAADGYHILKRGGEKDGETQVHAKHILICYVGATKCSGSTFTKAEAEKKAKALLCANG